MKASILLYYKIKKIMYIDIIFIKSKTTTQ